MIGHSEFPAASYDRWKLESPDDYGETYDPCEDCDHADYDVDFEGRADCSVCGHRWWLTPEQLVRWDAAQAEWAENYEREQRRERNPFRRAWRWLKARIAHWLRDPEDDEIPF